MCITAFQDLGGPSDQILDIFGPVLDAEGKPEEKSAEASLDWKPMHIKAGTGNRTWDSLVQSEGRYAALTCFY